MIFQRGLGFSLVDHELARYAELKSARDLKAELDAAGIVSKARIAADGSPYGSQSFGRGALYAMLQNRVYRGEITHKCMLSWRASGNHRGGALRRRPVD